MQEVERTPARRSNRQRSETTRAALLDAARDLFVTRGYADTTTPEIVAAAGTTRGALYHHFTDKRDLFRALLDREAGRVADDIRAADHPDGGPADALAAGTAAYLDAMAQPGRTRLLMVEGPAAFGPEEMRALDEATSAATLVEGLRELGTVPDTVSVDALAGLVSAAFDRAALAIDAGADPGEQTAALRWLLDRIAGGRG
ncbi:TetR/AcrR family transcriptional regulator [Millisia brevis]|uniref:TetR/AcrR family transcriptional regulator n=1 Tax=Millisia brevis TaxID=264148 RepID=UPI0008305D46|nr:TetR/AcrR family transcriptional regulator [Millisia brevis]